MLGRCCYILLRRRHDVPARRRGDVPLKRVGDIPPRRRWVFHLRRTCNLTETYKESLLQRRNDVLLSIGWLFNHKKINLQNFKSTFPLIL